MASQSGYKKTIFSSGGRSSNSNYNNSMNPGIGGGSAYNIGMGGMNQPYAGMGSLSITPSKSYDVIVDPWNNKYYGEDSKDTYLNYFKAQMQPLQTILKNGYTEVSRGWFGGTTRQNLTDAERASYQTQLDEYTKQYQDFDANYVQQNKMMDSWGAYSGDWNKFFEASYRNPRVEAEQKQAQKTQTDQAKARYEDESNRQQLFAANNSLEISPPRTVGTGVSASKDTATNSLRINGGTGLGI
jgi:hypothetical protein